MLAPHKQVRLVVYETPSNLEKALGESVEHYSHQRYHEALGNVRPADVYHVLREVILKRRKEVKEKTSILRRDHNRVQREREADRSVH
jgi:putative transposase